MITRVLLVGSNGYVGKNICFNFKKNKNLFLKTSSHLVNGADYSMNSANESDCLNILKNFDVVIFCSAIFTETKESKKVNFDFPLKLFNLANITGVKKFIFLSTTLVAGDSTESEVSDIIYRNSYKDSYSKFKAKAELELNKVKGPTDLIILRLSHIYDNKTQNFRGIFKFIYKMHKFKLVAFPKIKAKKSLLHIDNLISLITKILNSNKVSGTYYVNDGYYYNLLEISNFISKHSDKSKIYHLNIDTKLYKFLSLFIAKRYHQLEFFNKDLMFSTKKTQKTFNWNPEAKIIHN
jgi:nucleoside-diphosphate-sugar epimerase